MVTHSKVADMNYNNYEEKVIQRLKVKLVGWPFEKVVSPIKLYTIGELRTLRDALQSGACAWVQLSNQELKLHADHMVVRRKGGEVVGKTRKESVMISLSFHFYFTFSILIPFYSIWTELPFHSHVTNPRGLPRFPYL